MVKLVIDENGSDLAAELWNSAHPVASSILSLPEGQAALARARRMKRLTRAEQIRAVADFKAIQAELVSIGVDRALTEAAGPLAEELGLRGYDAVHLATALDLSDEETVFVTWDEDLSAAAEKTGLSVAGYQPR
ncbi:MAG: type II toxin-antitoxin system VapC family toxin [Solirubrobacterales bacterium]|nr:type II toxin-antitoxin system VapC family toxin [Solirubrobacterales bacterium]